MFRKLIVSFRDWYLKNIKWNKYTFGENFHVGRNVFLWAKNNIEIGDNVYIGRNSSIECNASIGNNVLMANGVALIGRYDHHYQQIGIPVSESSQIRDDDYDWMEINNKVTIGDDVWVGYGAIILSGVKISSGCIISAGAIVTRNTQVYGIYAGVPAKRIADRFDSKDDLAQHIRILKDKKDRRKI